MIRRGRNHLRPGRRGGPGPPGPPGPAGRAAPSRGTGRAAARGQALPEPSRPPGPYPLAPRRRRSRWRTLAARRRVRARAGGPGPSGHQRPPGRRARRPACAAVPEPALRPLAHARRLTDASHVTHRLTSNAPGRPKRLGRGPQARRLAGSPAVPSHQIVTTSRPDEPRSTGCSGSTPDSARASPTSAARAGRQAQPPPGDVHEFVEAGVVPAAGPAPRLVPRPQPHGASRICEQVRGRGRDRPPQPVEPQPQRRSATPAGAARSSRRRPMRRALPVSAVTNGATLGDVVEHVVAGHDVGRADLAPRRPASRPSTVRAADPGARRPVAKAVRACPASVSTAVSDVARGSSGRQAAPAPEPTSRTLPGGSRAAQARSNDGPDGAALHPVGAAGEDLPRQHPRGFGDRRGDLLGYRPGRQVARATGRASSAGQPWALTVRSHGHVGRAIGRSDGQEKSEQVLARRPGRWESWCHGPCRARRDPPGEASLPPLRRPEALGRPGGHVHRGRHRRLRHARARQAAEAGRPGRDRRVPAGQARAGASSPCTSPASPR